MKYSKMCCVEVTESRSLFLRTSDLCFFLAPLYLFGGRFGRVPFKQNQQWPESLAVTLGPRKGQTEAQLTGKKFYYIVHNLFVKLAYSYLLAYKDGKSVLGH